MKTSKYRVYIKKDGKKLREVGVSAPYQETEIFLQKLREIHGPKAQLFVRLVNR